MASVVGRVRQRFFGSAASTAAGVAIGAAAQPAIRPRLQSYVNSQWEDNADVPLSAEQAAQAALIGAELEGGPLAESKRTGVNETRFDALKQIAANAPPLTELLDLLRRGVITADEMDEAQRLGLVPAPWRARLRTLRAVLPSVTDMVRFAVREVYNPAQRDFLDLDAEFPDAFGADAENIGLTRERAGQYWAAHWELPSREEGAAMMFRGEISEAEYDALLKALDYAPTWRPKLQAISRAIPALQDMIRFAVREVYNPAQRRALTLDADYPAPFTAQAAKHGLAEEDARDYWAGHWQLPSATQGYTMFWRGEITEAQLEGLLKALDYAPTWRGKLRDIAYHVPGRIDLRRMFAAGVIDEARLLRGYLDLGYNPADARILTRFAVDLAATAGKADSHVGRAETHLWTTQHTSYRDQESDEPQARANLTWLGIAPADQDRIIEAWNREAALIRKTLSVAQLKTAYRDALLSRDEVLDFLLSRGYSLDSADLLVAEWEAA